MMGGADMNIVLNGSLDRDSRVYHLPYYKKLVEGFNKEYRGVDIYMMFPFIQCDKPRVVDYLLNNNSISFVLVVRILVVVNFVIVVKVI